MTLQRYRLDYSRCSLDELSHFIRQRGLVTELGYQLLKLLKDVGGIVLQSEDLIDPDVMSNLLNQRAHLLPEPLEIYRQVLDTTDETATFQFLELPPEMRNLVYEELFNVGERRPDRPIKPHLGILSTCKQMHGETMVMAEEVSYPIHLGFHNSRDVLFFRNGQYLCPPLIYMQSKSPIGNVACLSVTIRMDFLSNRGNTPNLAGMWLNMRLHEFYLLVYEQTKIRRLRITIESQLTIAEQRMLDVLSPLILMCGRMKKVGFKFFNVSPALQQSVLQAVAELSTLLAMEPELWQVIKIRGKLPSFGFRTYDVISKYEAIFEPKRDQAAYYKYANESELKTAIQKLEKMFEETWSQKTYDKLTAALKEKNLTRTPVGDELDKLMRQKLGIATEME